MKTREELEQELRLKETTIALQQITLIAISNALADVHDELGDLLKHASGRNAYASSRVEVTIMGIQAKIDVVEEAVKHGRR